MPEKLYRNYSKLFTSEQIFRYYLAQTEIEPLSYQFQTLANPVDRELEYLIETKQLSAIIDLLEVRPASVPKILRRLQKHDATSSSWEVAA